MIFYTPFLLKKAVCYFQGIYSAFLSQLKLHVVTLGYECE